MSIVAAACQQSEADLLYACRHMHVHRAAFFPTHGKEMHLHLMSLASQVVMWCCSARVCLPWKLAQILEGTRAKGSQEQTSMAGALAPMFPADLAPLIDMSGKMWAHTVNT